MAAMNQVRVFTVEFSFGPLYGAISERGLAVLTLPPADLRDLARLLERRTPQAEMVSVEPQDTLWGRQLLAYLAGQPQPLDAPLDLEGLPPFTRAVLETVAAVPYGRTITYGKVAALVGKPNAARAVGQVMHNNPVPLFVPCHRVLGAGGSLTGFGGGLPLKKALLELESGGRLF